MVPPRSAITLATLLCILSTRFLYTAMGIALHSCCRNVPNLAVDYERGSLVHKRSFIALQKCFMRFRKELWASLGRRFTSISLIPLSERDFNLAWSIVVLEVTFVYSIKSPKHIKNLITQTAHVGVGVLFARSKFLSHTTKNTPNKYTTTTTELEGWKDALG